ANDWSPDGRFLLYTETNTDTQYDLYILAIGDAHQPIPLLHSRAQESQGRFSPDGKWISYTSDESGRREIYVQSFPFNGTRFQVSIKGGDFAVWRRDGRELFYRSLDGTLMAVPVRPTGALLEFGMPKALFSISGAYEVSLDGQRFLTLSRNAGSQPS